MFYESTDRYSNPLHLAHRYLRSLALKFGEMDEIFFKVTVLATTMALALNASAFAADAAKATDAAPTATNSKFKNDDQQAAYALGASLGRYMENS